ncbi:MAG: TonB-dependent receptor [Bacteroidales bacterium]|nr:TonB-dependent receptor [Bacteroidales bacterium]
MKHNRHSVAIGVQCAVFAAACLFFVPSSLAQDTVRSTTLREVTISHRQPPATLRTANPTQVVDAATLQARGAVQLNDVVKMMSSVVIKDYGGIGGIKTVSSRGLGSQFSTVTIDGVAVNDAQNGQVDLGRYMVGNAAHVSFSQGHSQLPLLSARAYAAGNLLNIETAEPTFFLAEKQNLRASMELGSFGRVGGNLLYERKLGQKVSASLWIDAIESNGAYPYTLFYSVSHTDSSSRKRRHHSAVSMANVDANLFFRPTKSQRITAKLHTMHGTHQLPGAVIYYNEMSSRQSSATDMTYLQLRWNGEKAHWQWQMLGKAQLNNDSYTDSAARTISGIAHNEYSQNEEYLSASLLYQPLTWLAINYATDGSYSHLTSNLSTRNDVWRTNITSALALKLKHKRINFEANTSYIGITDHVIDLDTLPNFARLAPYVGINIEVFPNTIFRCFYKESYRSPSFSELYVFLSLPRMLRPEQAHQCNVGLTWANTMFKATCDAYRNRVIDKIVARPGHNMYYWSMENLGRVDITGVDLTASGTWHELSLQANYSWQQALDHTNASKKEYGDQIAYTPKHSGGLMLEWQHRHTRITASMIAMGERFAMPQNTDANRLPPYMDFGATIEQRIDIPWGTLTMLLQVQNLLDQQYEIVKSYPMMGRNFRFSLTYNM